MGLSISQALGMSEDIRSHSESYILDTEIMLGFAISKTKEYLRAHGEHILTELQEQQFQHMLLRRKLGEPIAYIVGKRGFWDFELVVNDHVLIPRPETEIIVNKTLKFISQYSVLVIKKIKIVEVGSCKVNYLHTIRLKSYLSMKNLGLKFLIKKFFICHILIILTPRLKENLDF